MAFVQDAVNTAAYPNGFTLTLGAAPTAGNILIAVGFTSGAGATLAGGWTEIAHRDSGINQPYTMAAWHLVGGGESATQTPMNSNSGGGYESLILMEVSGLSSTWTPTFQNVTTGGAGGNTTTVSRNTTADNTFVAAAMCAYDNAGGFAADSTINSGWNNQVAEFNGQLASVGGWQEYPTSGDTTTATITGPTGSDGVAGVIISVVPAQTYSRSVSESVVLSDTPDASTVLGNGVSESMSFSDVSSTQNDLTGSVSETMTIIDLAAVLGSYGESVAESLTLADAVGAFGPASVAVSENMTFSDTLSEEVGELEWYLSFEDVTPPPELQGPGNPGKLKGAFRLRQN